MLCLVTIYERSCKERSESVTAALVCAKKLKVHKYELLVHESKPKNTKIKFKSIFFRV